MSALEVSDLNYSYSSGKIVLENIHFSVAKGETFALLGPNGSGKSTLFSLISGYRKLQDGNIVIDGQSRRSLRQEDRKKMGICFQNPSLDDLLTVQENLVLQGQIYDLTHAEAQKKANALVSQFSLESYQKQACAKLSGGTKRKVEILKALMMPEIEMLLLDEPTTGLDPLARKQLWEFVFELQADTKMTILFTTHLMDEAENIDKLCFLNQGKVIFLGTPSEIMMKLPQKVVEITPYESNSIQAMVQKIGLPARVVDDHIFIDQNPKENQHLVSDIIKLFGEEIKELSIKTPTLGEAFIFLNSKQERVQ